jgi:hypothetical protein
VTGPESYPTPKRSSFEPHTPKASIDRVADGVQLGRLRGTALEELTTIDHGGSSTITS